MKEINQQNLPLVWRRFFGEPRVNVPYVELWPTYIGRILADVITGRDPKFDLSPFALDRFSRRTTAAEANVV